MKRNSYPALQTVGVPVHTSKRYRFDYVLTSDLDTKLTKPERQQFNRLFGIQTCPVVEEGSAVYAWDAEAVMVRMKTGKLVGTQLLRD